MDIKYYRYISKDVKVLECPIWLLGICFGIVVMAVNFKETIRIFFNTEYPVDKIMFGLALIILIIGRSINDKYFKYLNIENLMLKSRRTKHIKTPKL